MHSESINDIQLANKTPIQLDWGLFFIIALMLLVIIALSLFIYH